MVTVEAVVVRRGETDEEEQDDSVFGVVETGRKLEVCRPGNGSTCKQNELF